MGVRTNDGPEPAEAGAAGRGDMNPDGPDRGDADTPAVPHAAEPAEAEAELDAAEPEEDGPEEGGPEEGGPEEGGPEEGGPEEGGPDVVHEPDGDVAAKGVVSAPGPDGEPVRSTRRFPSITRDTARPEGGGRAAPGDAPAPARQWPLLTVLGLTGIGLIIVGMDAFADAFRVGTMLVGAALITGAVMRRVLPSVGMLAVRSRFTDMVTYAMLGTLIVLLALVTQPEPWLDVPFLEDAVHFTVR